VVLAAQGKVSGVSWDGFQREVLGELGLAVYALDGRGVPPVQAEQAPLHSTIASSALLSALLRAANVGPKRADVLALCQEFLAAHPNPSVQARRTLWVQLRRLRANAL